MEKTDCLSGYERSLIIHVLDTVIDQNEKAGLFHKDLGHAQVFRMLDGVLTDMKALKSKVESFTVCEREK